MAKARKSAKIEFREPALRGANLELMKCKAREVLLSGPAGSGKSTGCLQKLHFCCEHAKKPIRCLLVRKTRESLTESGLATFENKILPPGHRARKGPQRRLRQSYRYKSGSEIVVGGIDKPSKIMSTDYDLVYVQEATELREEDWEALITRLRSNQMGFQQILADCNPSSPGHWLKKRCDAGKCVLLNSRHEDNPQLYDDVLGEWTDAGAEYLAKLDALSGMTKERLRHGRWVQAEGAVYPAWDPRLHVIEPDALPEGWSAMERRGVRLLNPPPYWRRFWSIDFGLTMPLCAQFWAMDPDGRLYLYREVFRTGLLIPEHARHLLLLWGEEADHQASLRRLPKESATNMTRPEAVICDPEGAQERGLLERHLGLPTVGARKAIRKGIQVFSQRLEKAADGRPRLYVCRTALVGRDPRWDELRRPQGFLEEVEGYAWRPDREEPVKENDHAMDASRYLAAHVDGGFGGSFEAAEAVAESAEQARPFEAHAQGEAPRVSWVGLDGDRERRGGRLFGGPG